MPENVQELWVPPDCKSVDQCYERQEDGRVVATEALLIIHKEFLKMAISHRSERAESEKESVLQEWKSRRTPVSSDDSGSDSSSLSDSDQLSDVASDSSLTGSGASRLPGSYANQKKKKQTLRKRSEENAELRSKDKSCRSMNDMLKDSSAVHPDIFYNIKDMCNFGPRCACSKDAPKREVHHGVFPGESTIPKCRPFENNKGTLHHYRIAIEPREWNFETSAPTFIVWDKRHFIFDGFSIFTHAPVKQLVPCTFHRYRTQYKVDLIEEDFPEYFCVKDLDLLMDYLNIDICEFLDWDLTDQAGCRRFHFMPRFVNKMLAGDLVLLKQLLPINVVLAYLTRSVRPLVEDDELYDWPEREASELEMEFTGTLVLNSKKRPRVLRVDQMHSVIPPTEKYPSFTHFGARPLSLSYGDSSRYIRISNLVRNRTYALNASRTLRKARRIQDDLSKKLAELDDIALRGEMWKPVRIKVSTEGYFRTGLQVDIVQHASYLPLVSNHLRYQSTIESFETIIGYRFRNSQLLETALTHGSYELELTSNQDHIRNTLANAGVANPRSKTKLQYLQDNERLGVVEMLKRMSNADPKSDAANEVELPVGRSYQCLEFLGDKVISYIVSLHLFYLFPYKSEGFLSMVRVPLVCNEHLARIGNRLELERYMKISGSCTRSSLMKMDAIVADSIEAIVAAVYLDGGLKAADEFLQRLLWSDDLEMIACWSNLKIHPLQALNPEGDRHLIEHSALLQNLVKLEDSLGIQFRNIRLLARAFQYGGGYTALTLGSNERLEHLGDAVLGFLCADYLYRHFPRHSEGHLTLLHTSMVNGKVQAELARQMNLHLYVEVLGSRNRDNFILADKTMSNVFEAFFGALHVDKGVGYCKTVCNVSIFSQLRNIILKQDWIDPKSELRHACAKKLKCQGTNMDACSKESALQYRTLSERIHDGRILYEVGAFFQNQVIGRGFGRSQRKAETNAAQDALLSDVFDEEHRRERFAEKIFGPLAPSRTERKPLPADNLGSSSTAENSDRLPEATENTSNAGISLEKKSVGEVYESLWVQTYTEPSQFLEEGELADSLASSSSHDESTLSAHVRPKKSQNVKSLGTTPQAQNRSKLSSARGNATQSHVPRYNVENQKGHRVACRPDMTYANKWSRKTRGLPSMRGRGHVKDFGRGHAKEFGRESGFIPAGARESGFVPAGVSTHASASSLSDAGYSRRSFERKPSRDKRRPMNESPIGERFSDRSKTGPVSAIKSTGTKNSPCIGDDKRDSLLKRSDDHPSSKASSCSTSSPRCRSRERSSNSSRSSKYRSRSPRKSDRPAAAHGTRSRRSPSRDSRLR